MSKIRIFLLWIQWIFLNRKSVVLVDSFGEYNARLVHGPKGFHYAKRWSSDISTTVPYPLFLANNGTFVQSDTGYVEKWLPLYPKDYQPNV